MSDPMGPRTSGLTQAIATQLQGVHPDVPTERLAEKVGRTFLGALFVAVGLGLLILLVVLPAIADARPTNPVPLSLPRLLVGLGASGMLLVLGTTIWSSELMRAPIAFVIATLKAVFAIVRGTPAP